MTTLKKESLDSQDRHARSEEHLTSAQAIDREVSANHLVNTYDSRAAFFTESFVKKVKEGNRKILAELVRQAVPPTPMDLRSQLAKCIQCGLPDHYVFSMKDGKTYTMAELKQLIPAWAAIAETALIESDPALADKLMSPTQWNARSAFEVAFVNASNALKEIKKLKQDNASFDHYLKWVITPLKQALEEAKSINPPGNTLIGYGTKISLREAIKVAEGMEQEFRKTLSK
jgi:hypothetical protein